MAGEKGFFSRLFGNKEEDTAEISNYENLTSPLSGKIIPLTEIPDETFASGMLGDGIGIEPLEGKLYSPIDGKIETIFHTKHAVFIKTPIGAEVLIHVGKDTVSLSGEHFTAHVESGDEVKQGQLILEFDMAAIKSKGYELITPITISNSAEFNIEKTLTTDVHTGDTIIKLTKKDMPK